MPDEVFLIDGARTPQGRYGGALAPPYGRTTWRPWSSARRCGAVGSPARPWTR